MSCFINLNVVPLDNNALKIYAGFSWQLVIFVLLTNDSWESVTSNYFYARTCNKSINNTEFKDFICGIGKKKKLF